MYYSLKQKPEQFVRTEFRNNDFLNCAGYLKGLRFEEWLQNNSVVEILVMDKPTDFFKVGQLFIVSQKLIDIFERESINFEAIKADVKDKNGNKVDGYYLINILDFEDCFDSENSSYEEANGFYFSIGKMVIKNSIIQADVFRIKNLAYYIVVVSENIRKILRQEAIAGIEFEPIEDLVLKQ